MTRHDSRSVRIAERIRDYGWAKAATLEGMSEVELRNYVQDRRVRLFPYTTPLMVQATDQTPADEAQRRMRTRVKPDARPPHPRPAPQTAPVPPASRPAAPAPTSPTEDRASAILAALAGKPGGVSLPMLAHRLKVRPPELRTDLDRMVRAGQLTCAQLTYRVAT